MTPYLILGVAQLAVGAAAIFARFALTGAGPLAVAAGRLGVAAILLVIVAGVRRSNQRLTRRQSGLLAWAGLALAAHFATWIGSLEYTTVAISTLVVTTTPIFTALYDAVARKRRLSRASLMAFAAGGLGLVMVLAFDRTVAPAPGREVLGVGLALCGSLAIATYLILVREVCAEVGTRAIVTRTYGWAAIALVFAAFVAHQPLPAFGAHAAWAGILAMALISQLLGHTALNAALNWFSPSAISFTTLLEPVIAAVLAFAIFHESMAWLAVLGAVLVLGSIGVFLREEKRMIPAALLD